MGYLAKKHATHKNPFTSALQSVRKSISERPIEYMSIPAVAAFVGISTNWMGVKMLFYPIEYIGTEWFRPNNNCPYGLFGWQGVVPARTEKMASPARPPRPGIPPRSHLTSRSDRNPWAGNRLSGGI